MFAWSLCHITKDKDVHGKVIEELKVNGCGVGVGDSPSDPYPIAKFDYLDAVMKETIRKYRYVLYTILNLI